MNNNTDYYNTADYKYTEIGIALTDFEYGGKVQIAIPTITPFNSTSSNIDSNEKITYFNIVNADKSFLNNSKSSCCTVTNSFTLFVPWYLSDVEISPIEHQFTDSGGHNNPAQVHKDFIRLLRKGLKGTKFIISFVGGNVLNAQIIGRYLE